MKALRKNCLSFLIILLLFSCNRGTSEEKEPIAEQIINEDDTTNVAVIVGETQDLLTDNTKIKTEVVNAFPFLFVLEEIDVFDIPDMITGTVIYTLEQFEDVVLSERSVDTFEIDGKEDLWYKISNPVVGWVFAARFAH
jgi:hypothetical protein